MSEKQRCGVRGPLGRSRSWGGYSILTVLCGQNLHIFIVFHFNLFHLACQIRYHWRTGEHIRKSIVFITLVNIQYFIHLVLREFETYF